MLWEEIKVVGKRRQRLYNEHGTSSLIYYINVGVKGMGSVQVS